MKRLFTLLLWSAAFLPITSVLILIVFLVKQALPAFSLKLIFGNVSPIKAILFQKRVLDGLFPAIVGTLLVVSLSVLIATPIGVATGIYLAELAADKTKKILNFVFDLLASIPSIVIGLFGLTLTIFLHKLFFPSLSPCLLISAISLAMLILPYIVRTTQLSLEGVPLQLKLTAYSLGATPLQALWRVQLSSVYSGILKGIILAVGRAAEDTAVIMLTGAVAMAGVPHSLLSRYEALPFYIYYISSQYADQKELQTGFAAAVILLVICAFLFGIAHAIKFTLKKGVAVF